MFRESEPGGGAATVETWVVANARDSGCETSIRKQCHIAKWRSSPMRVARRTSPSGGSTARQSEGPQMTVISSVTEIGPPRSSGIESASSCLGTTVGRSEYAQTGSSGRKSPNNRAGLPAGKPTLKWFPRDAPRPSNLEGPGELPSLCSTVGGLRADAKLPCGLGHRERGA